jgi:VIT1/CCC1 family predicted Fe2+/Mn2+ transporter
VLLAGLAELLGGTVAMGLGAFLAAKSEREYILKERAREEYEVIRFPEVERREVRTIFEGKGYRGAALDAIVSHVTADRTFWVDTMMTEELGLAVAPTAAPLRSGAVVAAAYALGAAFPVVPYGLPLTVTHAFALSSILTLCALFVAGAAKTRMTGRKWFRSGLESAMVGAIAASATYLAGHLIASEGVG